MCRDRRAALHPTGDAVHLFKPNPQRRSLVPCRSRAPQCPAGGARVATRFAAHWWLLQGAPTAPGGVAARAAVAERPAAEAAGACGMALAWPRGPDRGWLGGVHARHGGEPTGVSAAREPGSGPRFPCGPDRGRVVLSLRRGV